MRRLRVLACLSLAVLVGACGGSGSSLPGTTFSADGFRIVIPDGYGWKYELTSSGVHAWKSEFGEQQIGVFVVQNLTDGEQNLDGVLGRMRQVDPDIADNATRVQLPAGEAYERRYTNTNDLKMVMYGLYHEGRGYMIFAADTDPAVTETLKNTFAFVPLADGGGAVPTEQPADPVAATDTPMPMPAFGGAPVGISAGGQHACAVLSNGKVVCWGGNEDGKLGDGTTTDSPVPVAVSGIDDATAVAVGYSHSCALLADGEVACWGSNGAGQLGNGSRDTSPLPVKVTGIANAISIVLSQDGSCATLGDGTVWCWGGGRWHGEVGDGVPDPSTDVPVPVSGLQGNGSVGIGGGQYCSVEVGGSVSCWGEPDQHRLSNHTGPEWTAPVPVAGVFDAKAVGVGGAHTCALLNDMTVACWGGVEGGRLGDGRAGQYGEVSGPVGVSGLTGVTALAVGDSHTCAVAGGLYCWGTQNYGELGDGSGDGVRPAPVQVVGIVGASAISAGWNLTCAIPLDGGVMCWGDNGWGQLGNGTKDESPVPTRVLGL